VPTAALSQQELDAFRDRSDRFIATLDQEYYDHYAGLKESFDLAPIYEEFADLTTLAQAQAIGDSVDGDRRVRELWRFACEGYLGNITKVQEEKVAGLEATLDVQVDGEAIGFRDLRPRIANEPDRGKRERLEFARNEATEEKLTPLYLEGFTRAQEGVRALGAENYVDLYRRFGLELDALATQCRALLADTEEVFENAADRLFRKGVGIGLAEAERWDVTRVLRATGWDSGFPADRMLPALEATLSGLGVDLGSQANVHLDLEDRKLKSPRAFCSPIEIPGKVMLVIKPMGGFDDWRALFHEAGHTEHFAHTSSNLSVADRRLGDNAVTEGWAALFEHLTSEPAWLNRRLDFSDPAGLAADAAVQLLWIARRYSAKLLYELEFHAAADVTQMRSRYVELLGDALKVEPSPTDYLADIDSGFYVSSYLRSWAFEAQLRDHLCERFGEEWFSKREAGSLLRELWSLGQSVTAEELLKDVTGATLDMGAVVARAREPLA
jgi:hypothetical protein